MQGPVVILGGDSQSTRIVYNALASCCDVAQVIIEDPVPRKVLVSRRIRKLGILRVLGQLAFIFTVARWLERKSQDRVDEIIRESGLDATDIPTDKATKVCSVNSDETKRVLAQLQPKVVVLSGTRIVSKSVLECVSASFVNMHAGITPLYRGVHGAYWALARRDEAACGVTVHLVDPGIDTGGILYQGLIHPTPKDNFATYPVLQMAVGIPLLLRAISDILDGGAKVVPPPSGESRLWSHPTLLQYLWNRIFRRIK